MNGNFKCNMAINNETIKSIFYIAVVTILHEGQTSELSACRQNDK
jgi:hypothetical protein